jgi:long-subunit acyl-CoA synthetase (AMP-forming)
VGYWRNPEASAELVRGEWLDSGDLMRADEDGYLWFFGRSNRLVRRAAAMVGVD